MENKATLPQRLESLDMLRGFDLFMLVAVEPVLRALKHALDSPFFNTIMTQFDHCKWEGFLMWDLVMPLFMFMAGVSIPFSLSKYKQGNSKALIYKRIFKRVLLLWILGAMCQGNLLAFDAHTLRFYSNTLQAIAAGYLIASMLYLHLNVRWQLLASCLMLLGYWAVLTFVRVGDFGGGNFTPEGNLAEWIDRVVLGRWRDGVSWSADGSWSFSPGYQYTWILSSVNFGVTVMSGLFAGHLLRTGIEAKKKALYLALIGAALVLWGWIWGFNFPIVKKIWTSSMTLLSSGYCFLLMGLFYYCFDCKKWTKGLGWLKFYGMNSILAYTLRCVISFGCIATSLFFGLKQFLGDYYNVLIVAGEVTVVFLILMYMYKRKIFLRV